MHNRRIFKAAVEGMWPFVVHQVEVYDEFDIDFNVYHCFVRAIMNDGAYLAKFTPDVYGPREEIAQNCAESVFRQFRHREMEPRGNHIYLGEE